MTSWLECTNILSWLECINILSFWLGFCLGFCLDFCLDPGLRLARVRFPRARLARMLNRGLAPGKTAMLRCCLARCPARALRQHHKRQLGHTWCRPRLVSSERAWAR